MGQKTRLSTDQLRQRLRFGDPAWGDELKDQEIGQMQERLVSLPTVRGDRAGRRSWRAVAAVATIVMGILIAAYYLDPTSPRDPAATRRAERTRPDSPEARPPDPLSAIGSDESLQQIRMTAPGGTHIVWLVRSQPSR